MEPLAAGSVRRPRGRRCRVRPRQRLALPHLRPRRRPLSACCSRRHGRLNEPRSWTIAPDGRRRPMGGTRPARRRRHSRARRSRSTEARRDVALVTPRLQRARAPASLRPRMAPAGRRDVRRRSRRRRPTSGASAAAWCGTTWRASATRPLLRARRQDGAARQARPAPAHARARRAGLRRGDQRPAVQALAVPASCATRGRGVAYGLFYDTLAATTFDLGCEHDNYHGFYRYAEIDDGDLDYYLFVGPRLRDVVRKFAELTGRMAFGPRWSLGYANTAMSLTDAPDAQAQLAGFVDKLVEHDVPDQSAFHFGSGYTASASAATCSRGIATSFRIRARWSSSFSAPEHPHWWPTSSPACSTIIRRTPRSRAQRRLRQRRANRARHASASSGTGKARTSTSRNPPASRWWQQELPRQVLDYGIVGWNDNNEYEIWDDDGASHGFGNAIPIERSRPLHALLMTRATARRRRRSVPDERVFTVTRAGPPGIQRYAQTWSGDNTTSWHTLRWNIRMGLTMSLSGMFNTGHDVGGFFGPVPDPELLVRWVQSGAFSPRFIMNSWKAGGEVNTPWLHPRGAADRPRLASGCATGCCRTCTRCIGEPRDRGEPMLRPLFFEFEDDPRAFEDSRRLHARTESAGGVGRRARAARARGLPAARSRGWIDFWTGACIAAGTRSSRRRRSSASRCSCPRAAIIPATDTSDMLAPARRAVAPTARVSAA